MIGSFFERIEKGEAAVEGPKYPVTKRHWGFSVVLDANTVINALNDGEPSVHYHRIRTEEYILYSGKMDVYRARNVEGDIEKTIASMVPTRLLPGDRVVIEPHMVHVPVNAGKEIAMFIEISHGAYLEKDIERIYDATGRDAALAATWAGLGYKPGLGIKDLISVVQGKLLKK